ncbi:uncharacterized protein LOC119887767 [Micropterus salmoides]|uniref:uncharacterized protein LOC119887767 n=1 Tax=Micropterus salmoides TaxID=27706 RepID=UPI0018EB0718|nr:uncharacterized protein LOC119887767 [Micropterus salmoides]
MGKCQSKAKTEWETAPKILSPVVKFMTEKDEASMRQFDKWVEMGFPANGSFSLRTLDQFKTMLERKERRDAEEHAGLSKKQQRNNLPFKADWNAYSAWRVEAELRERKRLRGERRNREKLDKKERNKKKDIRSPEQTNTLYPPLPEACKSQSLFWLDPDLASAPPPPYAPDPVRVPVQDLIQAPEPKEDKVLAAAEPAALGQEPSRESADQGPDPAVRPASSMNSYRRSPPPSERDQYELRQGKADILKNESAETAGTGGPTLDFRPWSEEDIDEAMAYVTSPTEDLESFTKQLEQFAKEYRPTMTELRRLMSKVLKHDFHKVSAYFTPDIQGCRLKHAEYSNGDNAQYRLAITGLVIACQSAFPVQVNLSNITTLAQGSTETCRAFLARLTEVFDLYSGLKRGQMGVTPMLPYEVYLKEYFLGRIKLDIAAEVKRSCISWKTESLQRILEHAIHAEDQLEAREQRKKIRQQKKLENALLTTHRSLTGQRHEPQRGRGGQRGHYDPCVCHCCGKTGHWRVDCPKWKGSIFKGGLRAGRGGGTDQPVTHTPMGGTWLSSTPDPNHLCS